MAEFIKLTRAEVIGWDKTNTVCLKEHKTEKGPVIFTFKVQTRVNDRADNSPRIFRRCSFFTKTDEEAKTIRSLVSMGALLEVEGTTSRKSFDDKETGKKVYYDEIELKNLVSIQGGGNQAPAESNQDDLPF